MNIEREKYKAYAQKNAPKRNISSNCLRAFISGGLVCAVGQIIQWFYMTYFNFTEKNVGDPTVATLIIISVILTGLGVYDKIAQWAGAGSSVPVTGFANSIASSAIEHKSEGYVLGVGGNMFKLAGGVIAFGVVSAFFVVLIKILIAWVV